MKKNRLGLLCLTLCLAALSAFAQKRTTMVTVYRQFKPSMITFKDGRRLSQTLTNVFLKNSSLLYMKGEHAMEAFMDNVVKVEFDDRTYVNINNQLAYYIDSVKSNHLYCVEIFDKDAYERNLRNNVNITNLDMGGDQIGTTTIDLNGEEDYKYPVVPHFYFLYNGEFVKVHEREIWRRLPKDEDKRRLFKSVIGADDFSWLSPESLMKLLKAISD